MSSRSFKTKSRIKRNVTPRNHLGSLKKSASYRSSHLVHHMNRRSMGILGLNASFFEDQSDHHTTVTRPTENFKYKTNSPSVVQRKRHVNFNLLQNHDEEYFQNQAVLLAPRGTPSGAKDLKPSTYEQRSVRDQPQGHGRRSSSSTGRSSPSHSPTYRRQSLKTTPHSHKKPLSMSMGRAPTPPEPVAVPFVPTPSSNTPKRPLSVAVLPKLAQQVKSQSPSTSSHYDPCFYSEIYPIPHLPPKHSSQPSYTSAKQPLSPSSSSTNTVSRLGVYYIDSDSDLNLDSTTGSASDQTFTKFPTPISLQEHIPSASKSYLHSSKHTFTSLPFKLSFDGTSATGHKASLSLSSLASPSSRDTHVQPPSNSYFDESLPFVHAGITLDGSSSGKM